MSLKEAYDNNCKGCKLSQGKWPKPNKDPKPDELTKPPVGGMIIELKDKNQAEGDWILNHYGGREGFLGWLALQPKKHKMELCDLEEKELKALGLNIKKIDRFLRAYWKEYFPADPIKRVYVVYFFEGVFDSKPTDYHLHIHLIPRTKAMDILLREELEGEKITTIIAWKIYRLTTDKRKEIDSLGYSKENEKAAKSLMEFIKKNWKEMEINNELRD